MTFLFEVTAPHVIYALLGGFVVFFGMFSLFIRERLYIGEAIWAFVFGVIIGPYCANIFDPRGWGGGSYDVTNTITLEFTRVVLAIGVFAIGVELPKQYMKRHWKSLFFLLVPIMTYGWFICAALIYVLIPGLNFLSSLVVAACLTPTDPILAAAVVGGKYADKHVPAHLRHLLAAESGCNDGAAFPFLFLGLYLVLRNTPGAAVRDWFLLLWLYQIVLAVVIGSLIGIGFRHLMKFCERKQLIDRQSYIAQYVSLALFTIGVCTLLGSDDLLAAFACGTAFAWDGFFNRQTEESVFSSVIDLLFNVAAFVFVGAWMPFSQFDNADLTISLWRLIVIGLLVLVLRRLPIVMALYRWIPDIKTFREAVFSGHFGPIGVGAIFISTLAAEQLPHPHSPPDGQTELLAASIQPIVAFMVLCSILVHGLSIPFFSLGRRVHSVRREWSRRSTVTGTEHSSGPEWMQQIRKLKPGEKPVVERDVERDGAVDSPARSDPEDIVPRPRGDDAELTGTERAKAHERDAQPTEEDGDGQGEPSADQAEEAPPDGDDNIVSEWREGVDRVVERRAGPGEEVEVEVQRNAFTDDAPQLTSTFRGRGAHVHNATREYLAHIRDRTEDAVSPRDEASHKGKAPESGDAGPPSSRAPSPDADAGWESDEDGAGKPGSAAHARRASITLPRRGRRRHSMRRSLHTARAHAGEEERGRQPRPTVVIPESPQSHSRAHSASPSVRWADEAGPSRSDSPRRVAFGLASPASSKGSRS